MGQYLIDNNVISNYFSALYPEKGMQFIAGVIDQIPNLSVITVIEALSWINPDKERIVQEFIQAANVLTISPDIVTQCVAIRRNRKMKTPDAIVAATAITHHLSLITTDKDYSNIPGLQTIDPYGLGKSP